MSDTNLTETVEPTDTDEQPTVEPTEPDAEPTETDDEQPPVDTDTSKLRAEAGKWRTRYREAETTIDTLRRSLIEHEVRTAGFQPAGFWASGAKVDQMLDEAGTVNADAVRQHLSAAAQTLGLRSSRFQGDGDMGKGKRSATAPATPTWGDLTKRKN